MEVQQDQKVIDTGLYGIVRHPMYMTALLLSMPLVLGSIISFVLMLLYIPIIAKHIRNEDQVLEEGLAGYAEYKRQVRYKVIPLIWRLVSFLPVLCEGSLLEMKWKMWYTTLNVIKNNRYSGVLQYAGVNYPLSKANGLPVSSTSQPTISTGVNSG